MSLPQSEASTLTTLPLRRSWLIGPYGADSAGFDPPSVNSPTTAVLHGGYNFVADTFITDTKGRQRSRHPSRVPRQRLTPSVRRIPQVFASPTTLSIRD